MHSKGLMNGWFNLGIENKESPAIFHLSLGFVVGFKKFCCLLFKKICKWMFEQMTDSLPSCLSDWEKKIMFNLFQNFSHAPSHIQEPGLLDPSQQGRRKSHCGGSAGSHHHYPRGNGQQPSAGLSTTSPTVANRKKQHNLEPHVHHHHHQKRRHSSYDVSEEIPPPPPPHQGTNVWKKIS